MALIIRQRTPNDGRTRLATTAAALTAGAGWMLLLATVVIL